MPEKIIETTKSTKLWFNDILWQQHKIVKNRERTWRKYGKQHHWKACTAERNKYNCQLHYSKQQSLSKRILDCKNNTKELFLLVNKPMGNTAQNPLPTNKTNEELTEDFARYFLPKIEKIRESLIDTPSYVVLQHSIPTFTSFCPLTESKVHAVIMKMKNKHCKTWHHPYKHPQADTRSLPPCHHTNSQPVPYKWRILWGLESCSCQTSTKKTWSWSNKQEL